MIKYVYTGNDEPKEWYCLWWDGDNWQSKVVMAHDREEVMCNIQEEIKGPTYDFTCCPNTPEAVDGLMRVVYD